MRYYIVYDGNYILGIYKARSGTHEISREDYEKIFAILQNAPEAEPGKGWRLRMDLTWEEYELPPEPEPEA